jgi:hypothetical protein
MSVSKVDLIELPDDAADRDRAFALAEMSSMQAMIAALRADNWRLIQKAAAQDAPPEVWLPLKAASVDAGEPYENVRKWCELGTIVAEKRGWGRGRWFVRMDSLHAHVAAKRGKSP